MDLSHVQRAAVARFSLQGFAATGIRDLGAAAGINSATLYHYVGSKQDLLARIISDCLDAMTTGGRAAAASASDPARQLAALVAFHVSFTAVNPLTSRVSEHEMRSLTAENHAVLQAKRDAYEQLFTDVLAAGAQAGIFSAPDLSMARFAIMEMATGVAHWYRPDGRLSLRQVQENFVAMAFRILAVPGAPPEQLPEASRLASEPVAKEQADEHLVIHG